VVGDRVSNGVHLIDGQFGWMIRSFVDKATGTRTHQLYVDVTYSGNWRFYQIASDETATDLPVTVINREVGDCSNELFGCGFSETIGVELPEAALRGHAGTGYQIQQQAKSGHSQVLVVTKEQIQQQFAKIDQLVPGTVSSVVSSSMPVRQAPSQGSAGGRRLGVKYVPTPTLMADLLDVEAHHRVWVLAIDAGSPAAAAGIAQGDVIVSINGIPTNDVPDLPAAIKAAPEGKPLLISVVHGGKAGTVTVLF
jgi:hypothetical protein